MELQERHDKLMGFVLALLDHAWEENADIDGGTFHDEAVKAGVIEEFLLTQEDLDGPYQNAIQWDCVPGSQWARKSEWVRPTPPERSKGV